MALNVTLEILMHIKCSFIGSQQRQRAVMKCRSGILAIPHSNADCERVFSFVRKTRTEARSSINNETLESLLIQKTTAVHAGSCHSYQFWNKMLLETKSATRLALTASSTTCDSRVHNDGD